VGVSGAGAYSGVLVRFLTVTATIQSLKRKTSDDERMWSRKEEELELKMERLRTARCYRRCAIRLTMKPKQPLITTVGLCKAIKASGETGNIPGLGSV